MDGRFSALLTLKVTVITVYIERGFEMATIDQYLRQILEATYGEEVRHSIHDAILQNYMDVSESVAQANAAADTAEQALADASTVVSQANQAVQNANTAVTNANSAVTAANSAVTAANTAAQNANEKATLADQKATLADTAATNANEKATLADQKATLADTAATNANTARDAANTAATNANEKATLANTAASNADTKAALASTAAEDADTAAALANTKAALADEKATLATTAASNADTKASLANTAAQNANEKATLADTAATNANTAKDAANTAATNASEKATEADEAAERANEIADTIDAKVSTDSETVSGNPIAVETDSAQVAEKTVIHLEPKQDLHGYDHPWPAGGGKNLLPLTVDDIKAANTGGTWNGNVYTYNQLTITIKTDNDGNANEILINGTANANTAFTIKQAFAVPAGTYVFSTEAQYSGSGLWLSLENPTKALVLGRTISDSVTVASDTSNTRAYIFTNSGNAFSNFSIKPMLRLSTAASGFVPYSNICPISGFDAVAVKRVGKNLLPMSLQRAKDSNTEGVWNDNVYTSPQGVNFTCECDSNDNVVCIKASGTFTSNTQFKISYSDDDIPAGNYYMSTKIVGYTGLNIDTYGWDSNKQARLKKWDGITGSESSTKGSSVEIKIYDDVTALCVIRISSSLGTISNIELYPMIRPATDTDDTFEPYQGETYDITFPTEAGTVYGGTLTIEKDGSGELVVDRTETTITGSNVNEISGGSAVDRLGGKRIVTNISGAKWNDTWEYNPPNGLISDVLISTGRMTIYGEDAEPNTISLTPSGTIIFRYNGLAKKATAQAALNENPIQVIYPLATPITYTLTAEQVSLLKGINNIFTDGTTLDLTYRKGAFATLDDLADISALFKILADDYENTNTKLEELFNAIDTYGPQDETASEISREILMSGAYFKAMADATDNVKEDE
jgi:hypothetical protein